MSVTSWIAVLVLPIPNHQSERLSWQLYDSGVMPGSDSTLTMALNGTRGCFPFAFAFTNSMGVTALAMRKPDDRAEEPSETHCSPKTCV